MGRDGVRLNPHLEGRVDIEFGSRRLSARSLPIAGSDSLAVRRGFDATALRCTGGTLVGAVACHEMGCDEE